MKKVGILGGVGPQATLSIYKKVIELSQSKYKAKNNNDYPSLVFASVPVPDFISSTEHLATAEAMMIDAASGLSRAGCDVLCIGSNTVHILLEKLQTETNTPFISMVKLVADKCEVLGYKKVALLGTPVLLGSGLYDKAMEQRGINLIKPSPGQIETCDEVIRRVIAGESLDSIKPDYVNVLSSMLDNHADAIILGCTELPLVLDYEALGDRILNSDSVLAEGIVDYCYKT